jgi:translation initiation factor IF-2
VTLTQCSGFKGVFFGAIIFCTTPRPLPTSGRAITPLPLPKDGGGGAGGVEPFRPLEDADMGPFLPETGGGGGGGALDDGAQGGGGGARGGPAGGGGIALNGPGGGGCGGARTRD